MIPEIFEPLPEGDYLVAITASEMKDTKAKPGKRLALTMDVLKGEFKGRKIFDGLNLVNENKRAEEIAQNTLSSICRVTSVMKPKKSEELHGKPFMVHVKIQPVFEGNDACNRITEYKYANGKTLQENPSGS